MSGHRWKLFLVLILLSLGIVLHLSFYNGFFAFYGDQGSDLSVAHAILEHGLRPSVGPELSIASFRTPPTYFYVLAGQLFLAKSPDNVGYFSLAMNILSSVLAFLIVRKLAGFRAGILAMIMYLFSFGQIYRSATFWQPYPALFFIWVSLYLLVNWPDNRRMVWLILSLIFYAVSVSVYPAGLLLAPFYFVHAYTAVRSRIRSPLGAFAVTVGLITVISLPITVPQILHERAASVTTTTETGMWLLRAGAQSIPGVLWIAWTNIVALSRFLWIPYIFPFLSVGQAGGIGVSVTILIGMASAIVLAADGAKFRGTMLSFLKPWTLLGFLFIGFYPGSIAFHRVLVFLPFIIIPTAYAAAAVFRNKASVVSGVIFGVVLLFLFSQGYALWLSRNMLNRKYPMTDNLRRATEAIVSHIRAVPADPEHVQIISYLIDTDTDYDAGQFLYFFHQQTDVPVPFTPDNNYIDYQNLSRPTKPVVYLICHDRPYPDSPEPCPALFARDHPEYREGIGFHSAPWFIYPFYRKP